MRQRLRSVMKVESQKRDKRERQKQKRSNNETIYTNTQCKSQK